MDNKTLSTIQTVAKVGKILSMIAYVGSLAGAISCTVGLACIGVPGSVRVGGVTIYSMIDNLGDVSLPTCYTALVMGLIICVGACVVARLAHTYFTHELAVGTPFTAEGSRELFKLGICTIAIPMGTIIAAEIFNAIAMQGFAEVVEINVDGTFPVVLGVAFIVASLFCKYGAELKNESSATVIG